MKCKKCGNELLSDVKFCPECGAKIGLPTDSISKEKAGTGSLIANLWDTLKTKTLEWWKSIDTIERVVVISRALLFILLCIALYSHNGWAIFFSIMQIIGLLVSVLLHKKIIETPYDWLKYAIFGLVIIFIILNLASYSWGKEKDKEIEAKTTYQTTQNSDDKVNKEATNTEKVAEPTPVSEPTTLESTPTVTPTPTPNQTPEQEPTPTSTPTPTPTPTSEPVIENEPEPVPESESAEATVLLPMEGTKLAKDLDTEGSSSIIYMNVDGTKNVPIIKKWDDVTVTDSIAEYLEYLTEKGYKVQVTESSSDSPYEGYTYYEAYFTASKDDVSWDMYMMIQDEDYVEYEFDIYLP